MIGFSRCLNINHELGKDCGKWLQNYLLKHRCQIQWYRIHRIPRKSVVQNVYADPSHPSIIETLDKDIPRKVSGNVVCIHPFLNMKYEEKWTNLYHALYIIYILVMYTLKTMKFQDGDQQYKDPSKVIQLLDILQHHNKVSFCFCLIYRTKLFGKGFVMVFYYHVSVYTLIIQYFLIIH